MAIKGSCLCGVVRFSVEKFTGPFEICHCNRCRKVTGSIGATGIGCNTKDFRLLSGGDAIESYEAPILHSPPPYKVYFCRHCGSPVPPENPEGDFMEILAGLLDEDPLIKPDKHIFVEHWPDWDTHTGGLPRFTRQDIIEHRKSNN